jgi:hypothetical protein
MSERQPVGASGQIEVLVIVMNGDHLPDELPIRSLGPSARYGHRGADVRPNWGPAAVISRVRVGVLTVTRVL